MGHWLIGSYPFYLQKLYIYKIKIPIYLGFKDSKDTLSISHIYKLTCKHESYFYCRIP